VRTGDLGVDQFVGGKGGWKGTGGQKGQQKVTQERHQGGKSFRAKEKVQLDIRLKKRGVVTNDLLWKTPREKNTPAENSRVPLSIKVNVLKNTEGGGTRKEPFRT